MLPSGVASQSRIVLDPREHHDFTKLGKAPPTPCG
jgi:hypothetical protein